MRKSILFLALILASGQCFSWEPIPMEPPSDVVKTAVDENGVVIRLGKYRGWQPLDPIYNGFLDSPYWNALKLANYGAKIVEVKTTLSAYDRGCVEGSHVTNWVIPQSEKMPAARYSFALGIEYGTNLVMDWAYHRAGSKADKAFAYGAQIARLGLSIGMSRQNGKCK